MIPLVFFLLRIPYQPIESLGVGVVMEADDLLCRLIVPLCGFVGVFGRLVDMTGFVVPVFDFNVDFWAFLLMYLLLSEPLMRHPNKSQGTFSKSQTLPKNNVGRCFISIWRGVRVAEGAGFENQCAGDRTGGSNPPLSVHLPEQPNSAWIRPKRRSAKSRYCFQS